MISVLTVNYYSRDDLAQLLASLETHRNGVDVELVICNNSSDEVIDFTGASIPVRIINADNPGFGAGVNLAFRASKGDEIFIANPDVRVCEGTLSAAIDRLHKNEMTGIVLPKIRYPDGTVQPSVRRFYTWPVVFYARSPLRSMNLVPQFFRDYLYDEIDRDLEADVDWGLGAAMFLRRRDISDGELFDERFFMYFEDVDLCYRTWESGKSVRYCPEISCVHAHRRASRKALSAAGFYHFQSLTRFVGKHRGLPKRPITRNPRVR